MISTLATGMIQSLVAPMFECDVDITLTESKDRLHVRIKTDGPWSINQAGKAIDAVEALGRTHGVEVRAGVSR